MSKNQIACCPGCGCRIPFAQFVQLNNYSATNCISCKTRIEIANRTDNAVIAGLSGCLSAAVIILGTYLGEKIFQSIWLGFFAGIALAILVIIGFCSYAYRHSRLNRMYSH